MKTWALVVGINTYPESAHQRPLRGAVADACDFADWVLDPEGGNVSPDRLYFWTHPWSDRAHPNQPFLQNYLIGASPSWHGGVQPPLMRAPTAREIATTIEAEGTRAHASRIENDDDERLRVYVYLAGHGIQAPTYDRNEETCFVAGDFQLVSSDLVMGLVPCDSFRRALLNQRFDEVLLFTDCCRSPNPRTSIVAQPVSNYSGDPNLPYGLAFAAQKYQLAYETSPPNARGAFSSALMMGLRQHRLGMAAELHMEPLRQYVMQNIGLFTSSGQLPHVRYEPDPQGPLIVKGFPPGGGPTSGPIVDVRSLLPGTRITILGGNNMPLPDQLPLVVAGDTVQLPPLLPGLYLLQVQGAAANDVMFKHPSPEAIHVR
jgi:hypothetical protein